MAVIFVKSDFLEIVSRKHKLLGLSAIELIIGALILMFLPAPMSAIAIIAAYAVLIVFWVMVWSIKYDPQSSLYDLTHVIVFCDVVFAAYVIFFALWRFGALALWRFGILDITSCI